MAQSDMSERRRAGCACGNFILTRNRHENVLPSQDPSALHTGQYPGQLLSLVHSVNEEY